MTPGARVGGFCSIRSLASACRRRVAPLMVQFPPFGGALDVGRARPCASHSAIPPFGGGEVTVRGGEVAVGVVERPKCRPPRRKTPIMGCRGRSGLRFGQNYLGHGVLFAREPAISRLGRAAHAHISGPRRCSEGPRARGRAHSRSPRASAFMREPACVRAHILGAFSHAIRLSECSTASTNVAIPTMRICGATQGRGNCMRNP